MTENAESDTGIYLVDHAAFTTEIVIASSKEEAQENAAGGYDTGDFTYGHTYPPERLGLVSNLGRLEGVGNVTIQRLLDADGPLGLGPDGDLPLSKRDETRLKNQVEQNTEVLD